MITKIDASELEHVIDK